MSKNRKILYLHPHDEHFPKYLDCTPPDMDFCLSIKREIVQNILVIDVPGKCYLLAFGRRRLWAARFWFDKEGIVIKVPTLVIEGTEDDAYYWGLIENGQRSKNPISEYAAVRHFLLEKGLNYKQIADATGMTVSAVKSIDHRFGNVRQWAVDGAVAGKIPAGGLERMGKQSDSVQEELYNRFQATGKLTGAEIASASRIVQIGAWQGTGAQLFPATARDTFYWDELVPILEMKTLKEVQHYLEGLRGS